MRTSFKKYLQNKGFSSRSIDSRLTVFDMFLRWNTTEGLEPSQVNYNDLLMYMKHCSKNGATQRTIQNYVGVIKHFYDHLLKERIVSVNPAADIEVKGVKRKVLYHILEPHELHKLYNKFPLESLQDRRNKVILGMLVYQGLTTRERSKLTVNDINLREGRIDVRGGLKTSGRIMQMESHQVMDLYDYVLQVRPQLLKMKPKRSYQAPTETDKLFVGEGGNCYSLSNFMTQLMGKVRKLNPSLMNAKHIRASVITKWLRMYNLREVQYLAGHRYISSTESYLENDLEELKEEVQKYHPLG